jgi:hypothetical protein
MSLGRKVAGRLSRRPRFAYLTVWKRELDRPVEVFPAAIELDYVDGPEDPNELRELLKDVPIEHRNDVDQRQRAGQRCFIARHRGQVVHTAWVAFGTCYSYLLDRAYDLASDQAYLHGSFTQPDFRRQGVQLAGTCHRLQVLRDRGFRRVLGLVDPKNPLAMRSHPKTGYVSAGTSGFVEVFGLRFYFHRDRDAFTALRRRNYWRRM